MSADLNAYVDFITEAIDDTTAKLQASNKDESARHRRCR